MWYGRCCGPCHRYQVSREEAEEALQNAHGNIAAAGRGLLQKALAAAKARVKIRSVRDRTTATVHAASPRNAAPLSRPQQRKRWRWPKRRPRKPKIRSGGGTGEQSWSGGSVGSSSATIVLIWKCVHLEGPRDEGAQLVAEALHRQTDFRHFQGGMKRGMLVYSPRHRVTPQHGGCEGMRAPRHAGCACHTTLDTRAALGGEVLRLRKLWHGG